MTKKTILITGGSRGIGKEIALKFARNDYDVAITYSEHREEAEETINDLKRYGINPVLIQCNFLSENSVEELFNIFDMHFDQLDVLVNNAGWTKYVDHNEITENFFDDLVTINLKSVFFCTIHGMKRMNGEAHNIINISSIAAYNGLGSNMVYCATKAGVVSLTKSFARNAGASIRVNSIAPGLTETDMTASAPGAYLEYQKENTPLKRLAAPKDIAGAAFSIVEDLRFVNGRTIIVDGGGLL